MPPPARLPQRGHLENFATSVWLRGAQSAFLVDFLVRRSALQAVGKAKLADHR